MARFGRHVYGLGAIALGAICLAFGDKREAMRVEARVKRLRRPQKLELALEWLQLRPL